MKGCRFFLLVCGFTCLGLLNNAQAQGKYPNQPIQLVVPFTPGGTNDLAARMYTEKLAQTLKVPVIVVNRGAGGGIQGTLFVARAKKDGYTLVATTDANMLIPPITTKEATFDPLKDFFPLGYFGYFPNFFTVRSDSPLKSFGELVEYARKNPGKLNYGSGGGLNAGYLNLQLLCTKNNIEISTIPFTGGGEVTTAILGGHVDMTVSSVLTMGPQIKAGKLRGLAVTSKTRLPDFPDIPTTIESGHPYLTLNPGVCVFAPSEIPQSVLKVLLPAVEKAFKDPEVIDRATKAYIVPDYKGHAEFREFIEIQMKLIEKIVKDAGLQAK